MMMGPEKLSSSPKEWIFAFKSQVVMLLAAFVVSKLKSYDILFHWLHLTLQFWMLTELSPSRGEQAQGTHSSECILKAWSELHSPTTCKIKH